MGQFVDITGNKYGKLTVIKRVENQGKKPMWLCHCECGNEKVVRADSLKDGSIGSCGCLHREISSTKNFKDITGQKFGRWTVLERAPNDGIYVRWKCRCECGTIRDVLSNSLLAGTSLSCGCYKADVAHELHFIDLTGQQFGFLTVIKRIGTRKNTTGGGSPVWLCRCECGNEKIALTTWLRNGTLKSCGCLATSWGESYISKLLGDLDIDYKREHRFANCRDAYMLPFDFYIPSKNVCIEYDGQQHYEVIEHFGGEEAFTQRVKHDEIKNKYCEENNIKMLRVPYYLSDDQIKEKVISILNP